MGLDLEQRMSSSIFMRSMQNESSWQCVKQKARKAACNISELEPQNRSLTGDKYVQIVCELVSCVCLCVWV